ncbi:MAG: zinc-dependent alcohol dehydrogenase family protein [Nitrospirae bacterium]|nr:zinc-dependent alcohol dehydrogenase family protein [Nitrospirota bacterium]
MRAMVLSRCGPVENAPLRLQERPVPKPGAGEVRVRVRACGVCRTDLHVVEGELSDLRLPIVPGHQVVGVVDEVGSGVTRISKGERVGIAWLRGVCGRCVFCRSGRENLCESAQFTGLHADGGYADYAVVVESFAYRIPALFGDAEATPLLCAGIIGYRALKRSAIRPGERLGLYGFGGSAHIAIQVARHWGCEVYVCTREASHRALARELGAVWVGGATEPPPVKLHGAILFAPAGDIVPAALQALERGGTLALAGIHMSALPALDYTRDLFGERTLQSVTANTREDATELFQVAAEVPIRPRVEPFGLEEANRALQALKAGAIKGSGVLVVEG